MIFKEGQNYKQLFTVTQEVYGSFQTCSQDRNPLHTDTAFAQAKGFPDRVMYGNILNAFISYFVGECLETNLTKDIDDRIIEQKIDVHPLKKLLTPQEVAETLKFLIKTSQQINGVNIPINAAQNIL